MRLPELVVAGGAGEVVRTLAPEEDRVSLVDHGFLLRLVELGREFHAARLAGDIGGDRAKVLHRLSAGRVRPFDQVFVLDALEFLHAPHQASLQVHHLAGVGEIARQFGERSIDHAGALAEIAFLERDLVRAGGCLPKPLAAIGVEQSGIAPRVFLEHLAVFLDGLFGFILGARGRHRDGQRATRRQNEEILFQDQFLRHRCHLVSWPRRRSQAQQSSQPIHARIHALVGMGKRVTHDPGNTIVRSGKSGCKAGPI